MENKTRALWNIMGCSAPCQGARGHVGSWRWPQHRLCPPWHNCGLDLWSSQETRLEMSYLQYSSWVHPRNRARDLLERSDSLFWDYFKGIDESWCFLDLYVYLHGTKTIFFPKASANGDSWVRQNQWECCLNRSILENKKESLRLQGIRVSCSWRGAFQERFLSPKK